jgi:hypothetical protein
LLSFASRQKTPNLVDGDYEESASPIGAQFIDAAMLERVFDGIHTSSSGYLQALVNRRHDVIGNR